MIISFKKSVPEHLASSPGIARTLRIPAQKSTKVMPEDGVRFQLFCRIPQKTRYLLAKTHDVEPNTVQDRNGNFVLGKQQVKSILRRGQEKYRRCFPR
jgi:hypothetical protein